MKNLLILGIKSFTFIQLLLMLFTSSCTVTTIEEELALNDNGELVFRQDKCRLEISGQLVNSKNLLPIEDASIDFGSTILETDNRGFFSIDLTFDEDEPPSEGTVIITKEGFLDFEFKVDYSEVIALDDCGLVDNINWDIRLTEKSNDIIVTPNEAINIQISDVVSQVIPDFVTMDGNNIDTVQIPFTFDIFIPAGAVDEETTLCITPNRNIVVGAATMENDNSPDLELASLSLAIEVKEGDDLFSAPIEVSFTPIIPFNLDDQLVVVGSNNSNATIDETGEVIIKINNPNLEERRNIILINQTLNDNKTEILNEIIEGNIIFIPKRYENCECSDLIDEDYNINIAGTEIFNINFPITFTKIQRALYIYELIQYIDFSNVFTEEADVNVNIAVAKCRVVEVRTTQNNREVRGSIYGIQYIYIGTVDIETRQTTQPCLIGTDCHQGCPN